LILKIKEDSIPEKTKYNLYGYGIIAIISILILSYLVVGLRGSISTLKEKCSKKSKVEGIETGEENKSIESSEKQSDHDTSVIENLKGGGETIHEAKGVKLAKGVKQTKKFRKGRH
jgi:hypothetical protein